MLSSDLHIHTVMSGHAFCTVNECIETAQKCNLSLIAITDHGPAMEHSANEGYFEMAARLPKLHGSLNVLFGCEMNILDKDGSVDLSAETMSELDIVLAGLHGRTSYAGSSEADNTAAIINAMKKHSLINIITHPYRVEFPVAIPDIVYASKEYNVLLEINASLLLKAIQNPFEENNVQIIHKTAEMIQLLQSTETCYIINSDAHYSGEIGISSSSLEILITELGILPDSVLNGKLDLLKEIIPAISKCAGVL